MLDFRRMYNENRIVDEQSLHAQKNMAVKLMFAKATAIRHTRNSK